MLPTRTLLAPVFLLLRFMMSVKALSSTAAATRTNDKMRILCLHGAMQSASTFSNKIAGARRKIERVYDLHFIDGPIVLESNSASNAPQCSCAWWKRDEDTGRHLYVREAFDYIQQQTHGEHYDAIIGFSQGGTLATALSLSGTVPGVRAIVTSGAPYTKEAFQVAREIAQSDSQYEQGLSIPKFHFAGERDDMVPVERTRALCEHGGNGVLEIHDQGHLFPTRALRVGQVLEFLDHALQLDKA